MGTGGRGAIQVGVTHSHELDSTRGGSVERSGFQRCKELDVRGDWERGVSRMVPRCLV